MRTRARRGLRTALVTGGLLMLGTGIANATENVPATPGDGTTPVTGPIQALGKEETDALHDTLDTAGDDMTNVDHGAAAGDVAPPSRLEHVLAAGLRPADEWAALTGDLAQLPAGTVFRVPDEVVGRAMDGRTAAPVAVGDHAPRLEPPFGDRAEFGPSDAVDGLLGANQVPAISDLFGARRAPVTDLAHTQVFPVLADGVPAAAPAELTQRLPVVPAVAVVPATPRRPPVDPGPRYRPMSGELPVSGSLPAVPGTSVPVGSATPPTAGRPKPSGLRDLPPVPTLPTLPALPPLRTAAASAPQDVPAGSAQQLMAQLRGLIRDLEGSRQPHPMGVDSTAVLPRLTDDGPAH
jgi:hypothetical protein